LPTILTALDEHAATRPGALALDDIGYAALRDISLRVAAYFAERGVVSGDRVAIYSENRPGFVFAYIGALRAGAIVVPVNVLYRSSDLAHVLSDAEPRVLCVSDASAEFAPANGPETIVNLGDIEALARATTPTDAVVVPDIDTAATALIIYTSGTTGRSKGAALSHANLRAIADALVDAWRWTDADTLLLMLPLFHVHGLGAGLNGTLVAGGRVLLRERFDAGIAIATLAAGEATMFFGVPTMYVRLLENAKPGEQFGRVRLFVSGSAALPATVHEEFAQRFGVSILERYGSTEFGFALSNRYDGPRFAGTVGFPLPHVEVRLANPDGSDAPAGEAGEILVRGPNVFGGYWRNDAATRDAFHGDWYRSGDLGTFDAERGYAIAGRLKELVISGGFNIYPIEVETELLRLPGIRAAAVVGEPNAARGEVPVAFIESGDDFDEKAALATLRERLASFKVPKALYRIEALPRNAMGKVEKPKLREMLAAKATT
jgi:malonyl-CoA/methylmalonyl-CoA synthetase